MPECKLDIVRRAYGEMVNRDPLGDWSWFFEEFAHDDLELRPGGTYLDAAPSYRGHEGWAQFWRDFSSVWEEWHWEPDSFEFLESEGHVLVFARAVGIGRESGVEVAQEEAHLWTVVDGKVQLGVSYLSRAEALDAAGLGDRAGDA